MSRLFHLAVTSFFYKKSTPCCETPVFPCDIIVKVGIEERKTFSVASPSRDSMSSPPQWYLNDMKINNAEGSDEFTFSSDKVGSYRLRAITEDSKKREWIVKVMDSCMEIDGSCWNQVIEDCDVNGQPLELIGSEFDNTLVRFNTIHDTGSGKDGIFLRDVSNVHIYQNEIYNIDGMAGIRASIYGNSDSITIDSNEIYNVQRDGIFIPQRSNDNPPTTNTLVKIVNNTIYDTGLNDSPPYPTHSIYCQAPDALIEGNNIYGNRHSHAISIRSSGIIRSNWIQGSKSDSTVRAGIRYFSDHKTGPSDLLLIENNFVLVKEDSMNGIDIFEASVLYDGSNSDYDHVVKNFIIRFNTVVLKGANGQGIDIHDDYNDSRVDSIVSGNLVIHTHDTSKAIETPSNTLKEGNLITDSTADLVDVDGGDLHLTSSHSAIGYATGIVSDFPEEDIDGDSRNISRLDAGADQFSE